MASKLLKVIIDTNLWISFLITKSHSQIDNLLINKKIRIVFSEELLAEFFDVIQRPKLNKYFSPNDIKELLDVFDFYGDLVKVKSRIVQCRDPKDNFLLSLAVDSKADYLLTGDNDLLEIGQIGKTKIQTITEFTEKK
ncbi:MAG: putative toxin-antitoxin system toxin component, PIN family [Bacteroidetes bacterium]|nr:putative toxin-antitoxin system toxin component, PIN family [Bacteroidota bacterium]